MPYVIVESKKGSKSGYRVRKEKRDPESGKFHYFSKEPISLEMAKKQVKALYVSESRSKK